MPTKKPRMLVTLDPEVKAELDRFAAATGVTGASFISQVLRDALPMIRQLSAAAEAAKDKRVEAMDMLVGPLNYAAAEIGQAKLDLEQKRSARRPRKKAA